jgi:serine/threonine-protein kinase
LRFKAREIIEDAGYPDTPVDRAHGFALDNDRLQYARDNEGAGGNWDPLIEQHPGPVRFWYRESPRYMSPINFEGMAVTEMDPVPIIGGMVNLRLDPQGRLIRLVAIPALPPEPGSPDFNPSVTTRPPTEPDWDSLFEHAGLELDSMTAAEPEWLPPVFCDTQAAWTGSFPDQPGIPVRVEAGAYRNRPVYFELAMPWTQAQQTAPARTPLLTNIVSFVLLLFMLGGAVLLARKNVRLGRGDRRGAYRLFLFMFVLSALVSIFVAHHTPTFSEAGLFFKIIAWGLMTSGMVWLGYLAVEPYARRLWPDILISWSRLLGGRWRDPLIGRDLLIGAVAGIVSVLIRRLNYVLPAVLDRVPPEPISGPIGGYAEGALSSLDGIPNTLAMITHLQQLTLSNTLGGIVVLVLLRLILRKAWIAIAGSFAILFFAAVTQVSDPLIGIPIALISVGIFLGVLVRFGMLASSMVVMPSFLDALSMPTLDYSNWYAERSMLFVLMFVAILVYAFYISVGSGLALRHSREQRG